MELSFNRLINLNVEIFYQNKKAHNQLICELLNPFEIFLVIPLGFEPRTPTLKV
jgi:hypothetical protein